MGRVAWTAVSQAKWEAEQLALHQQQQPQASTSAAQPNDRPKVEALGDSASEVVISTWRKAPFDVDAPLRDDHVYEAFIDPSAPVSSPTPEPDLPASSGRNTDCPDGSDESGNTSDDLEPPVTPSSGVFHAHTLPLTLPANRHRLSPSPSPSSAAAIQRPEVRLNGAARMAERRQMSAQQMRIMASRAAIASGPTSPTRMAEPGHAFQF